MPNIQHPISNSDRCWADMTHISFIHYTHADLFMDQVHASHVSGSAPVSNMVEEDVIFGSLCNHLFHMAWIALDSPGQISLLLGLTGVLQLVCIFLRNRETGAVIILLACSQVWPWIGHDCNSHIDGLCASLSHMAYIALGLWCLLVCLPGVLRLVYITLHKTLRITASYKACAESHHW